MVSSIYERFFTQLNILCSKKNIKQAVLFVFMYIDELLSNGDIDTVDQILEALEPDRYPIEISLAFLSVTIPVPRILIPNRGKFRLLLDTYLKNNEPLRVDELMRGL